MITLLMTVLFLSLLELSTLNIFYILILIEEETADDNGNTVGDGDAGRHSFRDGRGDYKNKREFVKKVSLSTE